MFHSTSLPREDGRRGLTNWFNTRSSDVSPTVSAALAGVITAFTGIPSYQERAALDGKLPTDSERAV